jgi:hypothetical protein
MDKIVQEVLDVVGYLETTDGDSLACITIEEVTGLLNRHGLITKEQEYFINNEVN